MLLDRTAIQRPRAAALTRMCLSALGLALAIAAPRAGGCGACAMPVAAPPSLAWDGETYAAAWAAPEGGKVDVFVYRFHFAGAGDARDAAAHAAEPERVIRVDSLRGTPELAAGPDGFLLLVHRGDGDLLALGLDAAGRVRGETRRAARGTAALCAAPGWNGESYAAAWIAGGGEGGGARLTLAFLDRSGGVTSSRSMSVPAGGSCALAVGDRSVALVYTAPRGSALTIAGRAGSIDVDVTALAGRDAHVVRLVATGRGFAILLRAAGGALRVIEIDRRGRAERGYDIGRPVAADTADLGSSRGGLFVSWTDSRRIWLAGLDADGALTRRWQGRGGSQPSRARALGRASECATAWTSLGGRVVHAAVAADCPRR